MTFRASLKPRLIALAAASALAFGAVQPAHALFGVGDIVLDPTNLVQNTMTAARTLEQINNQIRQLQNEAQMLINQARNLASLPFNVVNRLRSNLETTKQLIAQAKGLAYDLSRMDTEFARLYPEQYAATVSGDRMYQDARERWKNTLGGLQTAMRMQAQVSQNLTQDEGVLADLVSQSQSATGALQAMQATNQILALQAKQSIQSQQLQLTQDRAASLELARQAAAVERGREVTRRFLGTGTAYTPQSVNFYRNLTGTAMNHAPVLCFLACLLAGCDRPQVLSIDALATDPARLHALRAQCGSGAHDGAFCAQVAQADLQRFLSGHTGPDEYQTLADLPTIPASFDAPTTSQEKRP